MLRKINTLLKPLSRPTYSFAFSSRKVSLSSLTSTKRLIAPYSSSTKEKSLIDRYRERGDHEHASALVKMRISLVERREKLLKLADECDYPHSNDYHNKAREVEDSIRKIDTGEE